MNKLDKSKDRCNALLEEMQELIENLFHGFPPPLNGAQRPARATRNGAPASHWMGLI
jgi:hypothetical protein